MIFFSCKKKGRGKNDGDEEEKQEERWLISLTMCPRVLTKYIPRKKNKRRKLK